MTPRTFVVNGRAIEEWQDAAWELVDGPLKERINRAMPRDVAAYYLRQRDESGSYFHFAAGMSCRNRFRRTIPDDDLPAFDAYYGEGTDVRNWDDYYEAAMEYIVGMRS